MEWHKAVDLVSPYLVRITTPSGSGTGWLVSRSDTTDLCGVATAAHVIDHAHEWDEPIRLFHPSSGGSILLKSDERSIHLAPELDSAAIVFSAGDLALPKESLELAEADSHYKPGVELGWLGFPAVAPTEVCFFSGRVSAFLENECSYLIDGVAINGVSGGPVFTSFGDILEMVGIVSAYIPNLATGNVLPGVAVVRDVTQFHDLTQRLRNFDEAKAQESPPTENAQLTKPE